MKATFEKTVSILVKSYLDDTLEHGNCAACAVGNIIAHNCGFEMIYRFGSLNWKNEFVKWSEVFRTWNEFGRNHHQTIERDNYIGKAKSQIRSSGYSLKNLAKIEFAFETANKGKSKEEYMFNGLMAVVDVLAEIHGIDLIVRDDAKLQFVRS